MATEQQLRSKQRPIGRAQEEYFVFHAKIPWVERIETSLIAAMHKTSRLVRSAPSRDLAATRMYAVFKLFRK
jgi:hypothetical protein